ncbi:tetratricopeptide repeat protein [Algoriphagus halophilus]|uniref:tetratricopeptide repeat protein n=1 Tax=Algoriphagus halophilus TaxID=226505 RepID=UPI00358E9CCD
MQKLSVKKRIAIKSIVIIAFLGICSCDTVEDKKGRFLLKGNEKIEENDPKSAISFYEEAIKLDSNYVDAYFNKAMAHLKINQLDLAIHALDDALKLDPSNFEGYFQRGLAYLDNGEFYKAREDAEKLISLDDQSWKSFSYLAWWKRN